MSWRSAFLAQARSDFEVMEQLKASLAPACHQLHFLQMSTEKLAKAILTPEKSKTPPAASHAMFVTALRLLKRHRQLRQGLGFADRQAFYRFIDSLLDAAQKIEDLAPAAAGFSLPNPEYPWIDLKTGEAIAPVNFDFPDFRPPKNAKIQKIEQLVRKLLDALR